MFDYLLDNNVKIGSLSINGIRLGKREKIIQAMKVLRAWEENIHHAIEKNYPTAQTMNPAPEPPPPGVRNATQKLLRRKKPKQL